jgi:hypothetical protein
MEIGFQTTALSALAIATAALLIAVTGGIVYLTAIEWRDRRRQGDESRQNRPRKKR